MIPQRNSPVPRLAGLAFTGCDATVDELGGGVEVFKDPPPFLGFVPFAPSLAFCPSPRVKVQWIMDETMGQCLKEQPRLIISSKLPTADPNHSSSE